MLVSQDTILIHVICTTLCKITYSQTKIDTYLPLVQRTEVEKRTKPKTRIQTEFNKFFLNSFIFVVVMILRFSLVIHFGVEFFSLYRNLEEAFQSRHIRSIGMGATIPTRHICSIRIGETIPNRHIHSLNRHIHSTEMGCPQTYTTIRLERAQSFWTDTFVHQNRHIRIPCPIWD